MSPLFALILENQGGFGDLKNDYNQRGVHGSMLSIGSADGMAFTGQARGQHTFFGHLKWNPAIALSYVASILVHFRIMAVCLNKRPYILLRNIG